MSLGHSAGHIKEKFKDLSKAEVLFNGSVPCTIEYLEPGQILYKCICHGRFFKHFSSLSVHVKPENSSEYQENLEHVTIKNEPEDEESESFIVVREETDDIDIFNIKNEIESDGESPRLQDELNTDKEVLQPDDIVLVDCTQQLDLDKSSPEKLQRSKRKRKLESDSLHTVLCENCGKGFETELSHLVYLNMSISKRKKVTIRSLLCKVCGLLVNNTCLFYIHKLYHSPDRAQKLRERVDKGLVVFDVPAAQILSLDSKMKQFLYSWVPFFREVILSENSATKSVQPIFTCKECQQGFPSEVSHIESLYLLETGSKTPHTKCLKCDKTFGTDCLLNNHAWSHLTPEQYFDKIHYAQANHEVSFQLSTKEILKLDIYVRLWYEKHVFRGDFTSTNGKNLSLNSKTVTIEELAKTCTEPFIEPQPTALSGFTLPPNLKVRVTTSLTTCPTIPATKNFPNVEKFLQKPTKNRAVTVTAGQLSSIFTPTTASSGTVEPIKLAPNIRIELKSVTEVPDRMTPVNGAVPINNSEGTDDEDERIEEEANKLGNLRCECCERTFKSEESHIAYLKILHDKFISDRNRTNKLTCNCELTCNSCSKTFDLACFLHQHQLRCQVKSLQAVYKKRTECRKVLLMVKYPSLLNKISPKLLKFYYEYIWKGVLSYNQPCVKSKPKKASVQTGSLRNRTNPSRERVEPPKEISSPVQSFSSKYAKPSLRNDPSSVDKTSSVNEPSSVQEDLSKPASLADYSLTTADDTKIANHAVKPGLLFCEFCDRYFFSEETHIAHLKLLNHSANSDSTYNCTSCPFKCTQNCCTAHHMLRCHSSDSIEIYTKRLSESKVTFQITNPVSLTKISSSVLQFYYSHIWKEVLNEENLELDALNQKVGYFSSTKGSMTAVDEAKNITEFDQEKILSEFLENEWEEEEGELEDYEENGVVVARTIQMKSVYCKDCSLQFHSEAAHIQYLKEKEDGIQSGSIQSENIQCRFCCLIFTQRCLYVHHLLITHVKDRDRAIDLRNIRNIVTYKLSEYEQQALTVDVFEFYEQMVNRSVI